MEIAEKITEDVAGVFTSSGPCKRCGEVGILGNGLCEVCWDLAADYKLPVDGFNVFDVDVGEIRADLKMSKAALARLMGVSASSIKRWEDRKAVPSLKAKSRIKSLLESRKRK